MAVISIATLKTFFETGDKPTEAQFVDLIDTLSALPTPGTTLTADQVAAINGANGPDGTNVFATILDAVKYINLTNAQLITALGGAIKIGVRYDVSDATGGIVSVWGLTTISVTRYAERGGSWNGTNYVHGIPGNYDVTTNVFVEQGRISTAPTVNNDTLHGFYVNQELTTIDTGITYVCISASNGAAVWLPKGQIQFSLSLSAANLASSGSRFDIPQLVELPSGYMWNIINVVVDYIYGTQAYDSLTLNVEILGADTVAYDDAASISGVNNSMTFLMQGYYSTTQGTMKATGKARVNVGGSPTTGDGSVKIYGLAQLIKLI